MEGWLSGRKGILQRCSLPIILIIVYLQTRTRNQLFLHLVEEISQTIEDIDGIALARELVRITVQQYCSLVAHLKGVKV